MHTRRAHKRNGPEAGEPQREDKAVKISKDSSATDSRVRRSVGVSHAARLPPIVWVYDTKYSWWPGKLKPYPPAADYATVLRFGSIRPKSLKVKCTEEFVLPFEHSRKEEFRQLGDKSRYSVAFQSAFKDACQEQLHEDDDLPSADDFMDQIATQRPVANDTTVPKLKATNLTIPGEGVFALSQRVYYPARILEFNEKTGKYKVEFATGHQNTMERTKFYTKYEQKFLTCPLGELKRPEIDEDYEDDELRQHVQSLFPALYAIVRGEPDKADRASDFFRSGKDRRALAQKVGSGAFDAQEYAYIRRLLLDEFIPSVNTKGRRTLNGDQSSRQRTQTASPMQGPDDITKDLSEQRRLLFVTDVLLPETITRLTMVYQGVTYEDAHRLVQNCVRDDSKDISWVEDIYSARESFLEGRSFRDTGN
ncbi:hypothetical protein BGW42_005718 [Actinomortierella wolfii]|nr:hypothetical protein BGW42_005718 [Actinomortierella wolfii]